MTSLLMHLIHFLSDFHVFRLILIRNLPELRERVLRVQVQVPAKLPAGYPHITNPDPQR